MSDFTNPIETSRLVIRPYRQDDATWYYQMSLRNKSHLKRYESENPIMSINSESDAKKMMEQFMNLWSEGKYRFLGVFLKEKDEFVAQIYVGMINDQLPEYGIGYISDVESEGNGYVTEAVNAIVQELFEQVGAYRLQIETDDSNTRSIGVAERCGFVREGHLRENKKNSDGTRSGTLFFGLLKHEWNSKR